MEPDRADSQNLLGRMDSWSSSSSLIFSDSCDLLSSTLAVSGSVSTFVLPGPGTEAGSGPDQRSGGAMGGASAGSQRSVGLRNVGGSVTSERSLHLRPHRNLSITLSDPERLQPEMAHRTPSMLQLPNRRASSLREHFRRRQALTVEDTDHDYLSSLSSAAAHKRRRPKSPSKPPVSLRRSNSRSDTSRCGTSHESRRGTVSSNSSDGSDLFVSSDLCMRGDLLVSPRVSPLLWLKQCVPALVVSASNEDSVCGRIASGSSDDLEARNLLDVPTRTEFRRNSSISGQSSASEDNEAEQLASPLPRRGRRQAIFDSKSLGLDGMDLSPTTSCDESDVSSQLNSDRGRRRRRSSVDLEDLMASDERRKGTSSVRPLLKRNTIADFANTKAYKESTASLISASDHQDRKLKTAFSLLKLIDKKSHRSKDNIAELGEVLQNLKASEFKDTRMIGYKIGHWSDLDSAADDETLVNLTETERKRREAVWELFQSECVFLIDHLMVLKHCFMEPLKKVQVEGHLMFAEPDDLFGNLDELCYVSYTFSRDFISLLLKDVRASDFGRTEVLIKALRRFCQLTRDGEVYHEYCLNYSKATSYLEQLRKNDDFNEFEKWCCQDERCHRLALSDLLISPMQHCTKVPLLLNNIRRHTTNVKEQQMLSEALSKLETSLVNLEAKMVWLKNFERVQEIQQQIIWLPVTELEPRAFIPEFLRGTLSRQPCERLLSSTQRRLLFEGPVSLLEISKAIPMYMFLFDDILLLTKIKKAARKGVQKTNTIDPSNPYMTAKLQTEGALFVVHKQPMALDRITVHDVRPSDSSGLLLDYVENASETHISEDSDMYKDWCLPHIVDVDCSSPSGQRGAGSSLLFGCVTAASVLKNAFVLVQVNRFQQIIEVYTLQAPSYSSKASWLIRLHEAQENYKNACRQSKTALPKMATKVFDAAIQQHQRTDDDAGSLLASPTIDASTKGGPPLAPPPLRSAPSSRMRPRARGAYSFRRAAAAAAEEEEDGAVEDEEGAEEDEEDEEGGGAGGEHRRSKQKNRSSLSDAMMTKIVVVGEELGGGGGGGGLGRGGGEEVDLQLPRTAALSSAIITRRRISDPLRRQRRPHLPPGGDERDDVGVVGSPGPGGIGGGGGGGGVGGSGRSSSGSVFGGPTTHVVVVTVHAAEGSSSTLHRIGVQAEGEGEGGAGVGRHGSPCRSSPDRVALQKTVKHHSSLKVRRKGAMKVIQEKSQSFDTIQI